MDKAHECECINQGYWYAMATHDHLGAINFILRYKLLNYYTFMANNSISTLASCIWRSMTPHGS